MANKLASIRKRAPEIHVFYGGTVTILKPDRTDKNYDTWHFNIKGNGSRNNPYTYESAVDVSPHHGIIDLWSRFQSRASSVTVFIKANDWVLEVRPDGVVAGDGQFTKLS